MGKVLKVNTKTLNPWTNFEEKVNGKEWRGLSDDNKNTAELFGTCRRTQKNGQVERNAGRERRGGGSLQITAGHVCTTWTSGLDQKQTRRKIGLWTFSEPVEQILNFNWMAKKKNRGAR